MKLAKLCEVAGVPVSGRAALDATVTGFAIDHRKVAPGTVFGAFRGSRANGEEYIPAALEAGAIAVVARPEADAGRAVHLAAAEPRRLFAQLAGRFFRPVPGTLVAITGTNGKTSCVELTRQLWRMTGLSAASIGTLGITTPDESVSTGLTAPDIVTFLSNLTGLAREGVTHVAFEASSHGLDQHRTEGVPIAAAAFTNFGRDHLDYHGTMEAYFAAKMRLFDEVLPAGGKAIVWLDESEWTERALGHVKKRGLELLTVGPGGSALDLVECRPTRFGQELVLRHAGGEERVPLPLIGGYQAANAMISATLAMATGSDRDAVLDAMSRLQPVRGRLERAVITRAGAPVYVDFAHTPDAVAAALSALRPHAKGRLIAVVSAGGDRDHGKRTPIGAAAAQGADLVIVTDDNPRGEDPAVIRAAVLEGAPGAREIGDRRAGIAAAIDCASKEDIVLVTGKGHEQFQIIGSGQDLRKVPFDDVTVARECAAALGEDR